MRSGSRALLLLGVYLSVTLPKAAHGGEPDVPPPAAEHDGEGGASKMTAGAAAHEASLGDKKLKVGDTKGAMVHYNKALELDPTNADIYTKRGTGYMVSGKTENARKDLDKAVELAPTNIKALLKRARVHRSLGLFDAAVTDYETVKSLDAENAKANKELPMVAQARNAQKLGQASFDKAMAAQAKGDKEGAKRLFKETHYNLGNALKAAPDAPSSLEMDARCMLNLGLYADAIQTTGRLLKVKPSSLDGFLLRGQAYLYEGEQDVAMQHFKEGYKSDPDHKELKKAYKDLKGYIKEESKGRDLANKNNYPKALESVEQALRFLHGEDLNGAPEMDVITIKLREVLCKCYAKLKRGDDALSCARRVQQHDPESIEAFKRSCEAYMLQEKWDAAVQACENAVRRAGREQEARELHDKAKRMKFKSEQKDYYGALGVAKDATEKQIKKAYHKLSMVHHPDKVSGEAEKEAATKRFTEIGEAYGASLVCTRHASLSVPRYDASHLDAC